MNVPLIRPNTQSSLAAKAEFFGLDLDHIKRMIKRSAVISHYLGNRRFGEFLFSIHGGILYDFWRMDWETDIPIEEPLTKAELAAIYKWIL